MPLDPQLVSAAIASGLSAVCSTCQRYWEGRGLGLPEPRCTSTTNCGSPMAGDDFHAYSGPMAEFDRWCFVCSEDSKYGISVRGRARIIGVCEKHVRLLAELRPVDLSAGELVLRTAEGRLLRPTEALPAPKKSLARALFEAERDLERKS